MTTRTLSLSPELQAYAVAHSTETQDPILHDLMTETRTAFASHATMQISPEQSAFTTLLCRIMGVRRAVEVGTFTGLSALSIARGMSPDGHLLCCDISEEWTAVARRYWERAGVADRIELVLAPAAETLAALPQQPHLDLAFIDADKTNYITYWNELMPRMRPGGVILVDNTLWGGRVIDPTIVDPNTTAIRAFNELVAADKRAEAVILPIGDGLTLARIV